LLTFYALEARLSQQYGALCYANRNPLPPVGYPSPAMVQVGRGAQRSGARPDAALAAADGDQRLLVRRSRGRKRHVRRARAGLGGHPAIGSGNQILLSATLQYAAQQRGGYPTAGHLPGNGSDHQLARPQPQESRRSAARATRTWRGGWPYGGPWKSSCGGGSPTTP
jgi:hypothetical protein